MSPFLSIEYIWSCSLWTTRSTRNKIFLRLINFFPDMFSIVILNIILDIIIHFVIYVCFVFQSQILFNCEDQFWPFLCVYSTNPEWSDLVILFTLPPILDKRMPNKCPLSLFANPIYQIERIGSSLFNFIFIVWLRANWRETQPN